MLYDCTYLTTLMREKRPTVPSYMIERMEGKTFAEGLWELKESNFDRVVRAITFGKFVGCDVFDFVDEIGIPIQINLKTGKVDGYASNLTSYKKDGYLVTVFNCIKPVFDGELFIGLEVRPYRIKTQRLIMMIKSPELCSARMIINHINNCPFDNYPENLEVTNLKLNSLHGILVHSLNYFYPFEFTHLSHNLNPVGFVTLNSNRLFNCKDVKDFFETSGIVPEVIKNDTRESWHFCKETVDHFISYMYDKGVW